MLNFSVRLSVVTGDIISEICKAQKEIPHVLIHEEV